MKVKELIEELSKLDQEATIYKDLGDLLSNPWMFSVSPISIAIDSRSVDSNRVASRPCKETENTKKGYVFYVK